MKIKRKLGTSVMVLLAVLLSDCGRSADKARNEAHIDSLDKVREAAITLRVAIHDGTHYNELRPFIQKLAIEIAIAKEKGEDSEAFRRYDFALSEIQHNYDTGAVLGFWVVPLRAMDTLDDAMLIQRGQPPKWQQKLPVKDW